MDKRFIIGFIVVLSAFIWFFSHVVHSQTFIIPQQSLKNAPQGDLPLKEIEGLIRQYSVQYRVNYRKMLALAKCESSLRQFDKGEVLHGRVHPADKGIFQINTEVWDEASLLTGYDWRTTEGNIQLASLIASEYGYSQWSCDSL